VGLVDYDHNYKTQYYGIMGYGSVKEIPLSWMDNGYIIVEVLKRYDLKDTLVLLICKE
jgi:hypothetical protein